MTETLNRRRFLQSAGLYLAATGASCMGCNNAFAQQACDNTIPGFECDDLPTTNSKHIRGCALNALQSGQIKIQLEYPESWIAKYIAWPMGRRLGFKPSFAQMSGVHSGNAFALVSDITHVLGRKAGYGDSKDGAIIFGKRLTDAIFKYQGDYDYETIVAVMAHEYAHIAQFKYGVEFDPFSAKPTELMADFVAGWVVASDKYYNNIYKPMQFVYSLGDLDFNSPQHHGTPNERLNAYRQGIIFHINNRHGKFFDALQRGYDLYV